MRLSINVDSIDTEEFRRFLAHMTGGESHGIGKVNARLNGPEKWAGESEPRTFRTAADAADFLRGLADRLAPSFSDAPIRHLTEPDPELDRLIAEEEEIEVESHIRSSGTQDVFDTAAALLSDGEQGEYDRALAELIVDLTMGLNQDQHKDVVRRLLNKKNATL